MHDSAVENWLAPWGIGRQEILPRAAQSCRKRDAPIRIRTQEEAASLEGNPSLLKGDNFERSRSLAYPASKRLRATSGANNRPLLTTIRTDNPSVPTLTDQPNIGRACLMRPVAQFTGCWVNEKDAAVYGKQARRQFRRVIGHRSGPRTSDRSMIILACQSLVFTLPIRPALGTGDLKLAIRYFAFYEINVIVFCG
jgi:hypothetical protein